MQIAIFAPPINERMFQTIGHHTCRNGQKAYLEQNAPFKSCSKTEGETYLGDGYYFWDNNIEKARWWGKTHYPIEGYNILEYDLNIEDDQFLDLVGSREDLIHFKRLSDKFKEKYPQKATISQCICFYRKMEAKKQGTFPYNAIRVCDIHDKKRQAPAIFGAEKKGVLLLDPCYIICLYNKDSLAKGKCLL